MMEYVTQRAGEYCLIYDQKGGATAPPFLFILIKICDILKKIVIR